MVSSGAVSDTGRAGALGAPVLPGSVPLQVLGQMQSAGLELVADQAQAQEVGAEVVLGGFGIEGRAVLRACATGVDGEGGDGQDKLDVRFDLPGVKRAVEKAELDGTAAEYVVQVQGVVAAYSVPKPVELVDGLRSASPAEFAYDTGVDVAAVSVGPADKRLERVLDQALFARPVFDQADERRYVENRSVYVDVDSAGCVDPAACPAYDPRYFLQGLDIAVPEDRRYDFGAVAIYARVVYDLPGSALSIDDPLRVSDALVAPAHPLRDGPGRALLAEPRGFDFYAKPDVLKLDCHRTCSSGSRRYPPASRSAVTARARISASPNAAAHPIALLCFALAMSKQYHDAHLLQQVFDGPSDKPA